MLHIICHLGNLTDIWVIFCAVRYQRVVEEAQGDQLSGLCKKKPRSVVLVVHGIVLCLLVMLRVMLLK